MRRLLALAAAFALTVSLAACGDDDDDDTAAETADTTESTAADTEATDMTTGDASGEATLAVATSDLGENLVDGGGVTLYLFDNDTDGTSSCVDSCAENWPPLLVEGDPVAGEGVDATLLATTARPDGTTQVTYNGHPLYRFAGDAAAGETKGQAVGDVWWVVSPTGEAIS